VLRTNVGDGLQLSPNQYWEKRARVIKGSREVAYQASSLIELTDADFDKLVAFYSQSEAAAKVRAVPYFPLLAWRYGASVTGAIVVEIEADSPLVPVGLKVGDIVVQIGGQEVKSAADLAKLLPKAIDDSATKEVILQVKRGDGGDDDVVPLKLTRATKGPIRRNPGRNKGGK
jgi:C-terminal processing protease CtpA/Prc